MNGVEAFFAYSREREAIRIRKASGSSYPFTTDPVLGRFYFCNIFREDDRTTIWYRDRIRDRLAADRRVLAATIIFRWFNRISTGELIADALLRGGRATWPDLGRIERALRPLQLRGEQIFTSAFIINSRPGTDKLSSILECIEAARDLLDGVSFPTSLEATHTWLRRVPRLGPFMAYEVVTDLRRTAMLDSAPDVLTWASAGPGCARGIRWVFGGERPLSYGSPGGQRAMLARMLELLAASRDPSLWPYLGRPWEMREVEHTLCEFDKYRRGQTGTGERLKRIWRAPTCA